VPADPVADSHHDRRQRDRRRHSEENPDGKKKKKRNRRGPEKRTERAPASQARREEIRTLVKLEEANRLCECKPYLDHDAGCEYKNLKMPHILLSKSYDYDAMKSQTDQLRADIETANRIDAKLLRDALRKAAAEEAATGG
jgi:hypothetical protein